MASGTTTGFATGERVRIQVSRGWHLADHFRKSSGWIAGRVLAMRHEGRFVAVVDRSGRVWPTCNPVCVRAVAS